MESSCPVRTNSWVWASTPGVTRTRTLGRSRGRRGRLEQPAQPCHLVEGVHHDAPDAGLEGGGELVGRLVVAVQDEPGGGYPGRQGDVELPAGGDVEVHALLVGQSGHGAAEEGLGGVGHTVTPGGGRLPAGTAQVVLVIDEQRRTELGRQVEQVDVPHPEVPVLTHLGRVRQEVTLDGRRGDVVVGGRRGRGCGGRWRGGCWRRERYDRFRRRSGHDGAEYGRSTEAPTRPGLRSTVAFVRPRGVRTRPRSSADRAPASGAGGAGSSPAGGALHLGPEETIRGTSQEV